MVTTSGGTVARFMRRRVAEGGQGVTGSGEPLPQHDAGLGDVNRWPRVSAQNLAGWYEYPASAMQRRWMRWEDAWAADEGSPAAYLNSATLQQPLSDERAAELVGRLAAFYGGGAGGPWLLWSPWPTPDLQAYGLRLLGHPPLMVRPVGAGAP